MIIYKSKVFPLLLYFTILLCSCNDNKALLEKYNEVKVLIEANDFENLVANLDKRSREYIEFMVDTSHYNYDTIVQRTRDYELSYYSVDYLFEFSKYSDPDSNKYDILFFYYKLTGVPIFNILSEYNVLEDECKTGEENYVVVARRANQNTFVTKKVRFIKEADEYKLNLIDLLSRNEKNLKKAVNSFKRQFDDKIIDELQNNELFDQSRIGDYLYCYMHYSKKDELKSNRYIYDLRKTKRRRVD